MSMVNRVTWIFVFLWSTLLCFRSAIFSWLHFSTMSQTLITCRAIQLRFSRVKTLLNNALKTLGDTYGRSAGAWWSRRSKLTRRSLLWKAIRNTSSMLGTTSLYAVKAQTSLAPLSRFRGSHVITALAHQCCRFQSYAKTVPSQMKLTMKLTKREPTFLGSTTTDHVITACDVRL